MTGNSAVAKKQGLNFQYLEAVSAGLLERQVDIALGARVKAS